MPGASPDYPAPVVRNTEHGTELTMMRWGMPPPPADTCLVPFNSFAEYAPVPNPVMKLWSGSRSRRADRYAPSGIWTEYRSDLGHEMEADPRPPSGLRFPDDRVERGCRTDPSEAMLVILTTDKERDVWMRRSEGAAAAVA